MRVVMSVLCSHCESAHVERVIRRGLRDMVHNLLGNWPYVCRSCQKRSYSKCRRNSTNKGSERSMPDSSVRSSVDCAARQQGANAAVVIRAESEHQLTNILLALSRAIKQNRWRARPIVTTGPSSPPAKLIRAQIRAFLRTSIPEFR
jgi:hypothetical protein